MTRHALPATPPAACHQLFALARQVWELAEAPDQQSPEQWDAMASRLSALGRSARPTALRVGVALDQMAANARGRAVRRPFRGRTGDELLAVALALSDLAVEWSLAPPPAPAAPPAPPPPLPPGVADFAAHRARRRAPATTSRGGAA